MGGAAIGLRVTRGLAHLVLERATGEALRQPLAMRRARRVGGLHGGAQRQGIDRAAVLGECLEVSEAEGDQSAARRRRRIEGHARAVMPPIKRLA